MKANELMIGDLVNLSKGNWSENRQVELIDIEMIAESVYLADPIPLTAEILEKNGFETEDAKDGGFVLCDDFYDIFIYEWSDSIWVARYESTEMNIPFEQATMSYVYELQHFLKSNGVEKEIEL